MAAIFQNGRQNKNIGNEHTLLSSHIIENVTKLLGMVGMYVTHNKKHRSVYYVLLRIENLLHEAFTIRPIEKMNIFDVLTFPDY